LVHAGSANIIDHFDHRTELRPRIAFRKTRLSVRLASDPSPFASDPLRRSCPCKENCAVALNRYQQRIFFIGVRHGLGLLTFAMSTLTPFCNMADHHEDDQKH